MSVALSTITTQADREDNVLMKRDDPAQGGVRYIGEARVEAGQAPADSSAVWRIRREIITGTQTFQEYALLGQFVAKWSLRTTYFANVPAIFNALSTQFDGVNDIAQASANPFTFTRTAPFSVSFWVKLASLTNAQCMMSVKNTLASNDGWAVSQFTSASGVIRFQFMVNNTTNGLVVETTAAAVAALVWAHIVVTYDGSSAPAGVKIYKNGVSQALTTIQNDFTSNPAYTSQLFSLGSYSSNASNLNGKLDEVSVWTLSLSAAQALELYNSGSPSDIFASSIYAASASNLGAWYRMGDVDTFPTILDLSANKYHLTMTNMASNAFVADTPP